MAGKQAKTLSTDHIDDLLFFAERTRHPLRNRLVVLLSVKAGLRAAEIAKLTWDMVLDPTGEVGRTLVLQDKIAKKRGGRSIPLHADLREALADARQRCDGRGPVMLYMNDQDFEHLLSPSLSKQLPFVRRNVAFGLSAADRNSNSDLSGARGAVRVVESARRLRRQGVRTGGRVDRKSDIGSDGASLVPPLTIFKATGCRWMNLGLSPTIGLAR